MVIVEGGDEEGDEEFREDIKTAIGHVRQDVKKFRRSPKSNAAKCSSFIPERTEVDIRCQNQMEFVTRHV